MKESELTPADAAAASELMVIPEGGSALGRDPFAEDAEPDPFVNRLEALELRWTARRPGQPPRPRADTVEATPVPEPREQTRRTQRGPEPLARRRRTTTPALAEIEVPEVQGLLDRALSAEDRKRLAALSHMVEGEAPYDRFGFSPGATRVAFPLFLALYRLYFRVKSEGHENLPKDGPAVLAGNHAGLLPFDAAMGVMDILLNSDPPRLARAVVDRWAGSLPWVNIFFARVGQVVGTRENFANLLGDGQLVFVFPEGMEGIRKTITQRYRLQAFRVGFIEHALRARAPIVPMAIIGSDDQAPILYNFKPLARRLGLPVAPITPTFPWLGPLGLLPYPVSYKIVYGEPLNFHERFGPEGADDARLVRYLANQVRRTVQQLIDRSRM